MDSTPQQNQDQNAGGLLISAPYDVANQHLDVTYNNIKNGKFDSDITTYETPTPMQQLVVNGPGNEFHGLDNIFDWHNSKAFLNKCTDCNIYVDVAPFVETAVVIKSDDNANMARNEQIFNIVNGEYINACFIKSAFRETDPNPKANEQIPYGLIIATQGPKSNTIEHFWTMVVQQNVQKIITLCQQFGDSYHADAVQYFPSQSSGDVMLTNLTLKLKEQKDEEFVITRKIQVHENSNGTVITEVTHHHFKGWADWQVPVDNSMTAYQALIKQAAAFVKTIYQEQKNNASDASYKPRRLLVHCKAGIGRTGTTIALINMVCQIEEQKLAAKKDPSKILLSPFSTVRQLREQRVYMCQTDNQYDFIYQFLQAYKIE